MVLGKLGSYTQKDETGSLSHTIHKSKIKMDQRLNVRPETIKLLEGNSMLFDVSLTNIF